MGNGFAVGHAHHVVMEHNAAHAREHGATGLQRISRSVHCGFRAAFHLVAGLSFGPFVKSAVLPVTVWTEDAGKWSRLVLGPIKVAANIVTGHRSEEHFFDGVLVAVDVAVDDGMKRGF